MPPSTSVASYWQALHVSSPLLPELVPVIAALDVPYAAQENRLQSLHLYLPHTPENARLVGTPVQSLPGKAAASTRPRYYVHIHGGAWRDPQLSATSIEPTVAYAFAKRQASSPITAIASLNYTLTQFPTHPTLPYATGQAGSANPTREAVHPQHVHDALRGLALLRALGMTDGSYLLSGHSCGACIALEAILQSPQHYGLRDVADAPCPAALLGVNGLYDLPALVDKLGGSHEHLRPDYLSMLTNVFGPDQTTWLAASPAGFAPATIQERLGAGLAPRLVVLDQSPADQLVPPNQLGYLEATLRQVTGLRVVQGHRAQGLHAAPWHRGDLLWASVQDVIDLLSGSPATTQ
jgi:kynurenine formamidase